MSSLFFLLLGCFCYVLGVAFFCILVVHVFETKSYHVAQTGLKGMTAASAQLPKSQSYKHKITVTTDTEKNKVGWRCFGVGGSTKLVLFKTSWVPQVSLDLLNLGKADFFENVPAQKVQKEWREEILILKKVKMEKVKLEKGPCDWHFTKLWLFSH